MRQQRGSREETERSQRTNRMDRVFSVDDISDPFWPQIPAPVPPVEDPKMKRIDSEWAFEMFLQEAATTPLSLTNSPSKSVRENDVIEIEDYRKQSNPVVYQHESNKSLNRTNGAASQPNHSIRSMSTTPSAPVDSDKYQALLESRLNLACAAVALTRAPFVIGQGSSGTAQSMSQGSADSKSAAAAPCKGSQVKNVVGPVGIPSLPALPKKIVAQIKPTTSVSSRDLSDDDEAEGEVETTENMDPSDVKRVKRMISNRESARRSRRRKQAHLTELETQVSQLKVENSSLLERLTDISQKYNEAAVDNRVLKADIETLRAKVKMAEETVKRITGMNPLLQAMSEISTMSYPAFSGSPIDSSDAAVPDHGNPRQHLYETPVPSIPIPAPVVASVQNVIPNQVTPAVAVNKPERTPSMQRVASLEHLQKKIRGGINRTD